MTNDVQDEKKDEGFLVKTIKFLDKEAKDFKRTGSIGGYLADKATDLAVLGAEKIGAEYTAQTIEENRSAIVGALGETINVGVSSGLTALAASNQSGIVQSATLALRQELLGQKGELPNNPVATSQNMRIQMRINDREKEKQNQQEQPSKTTVHQTTINQNITSGYEMA